MAVSLVLSIRAFAAEIANMLPEPIAITPSSGSITSPVPERIKEYSLSATHSIASNLRNILSERHSFAISTADAFTLFERFEGKLEECSGNLTKASVDMAKEWRSDKMLRRLEAMLCVADKEYSFILSGTGDVIEPEDGVMAIGSGSMFAISAAKALMDNTKLTAKEIALKSMEIASDICIYTNRNFNILEL